MPSLEFWFEFASTYSYPAAMQVEERCRAAGVDLQWRPFLLGPIFQSQGWDDSPFNLYPAKGRYMWRDLERICAAQGIPFSRPEVFPQNGLLGARVACAHQTEPWVGAFVRGLYQANFARGQAIHDPAVVEEALGAAGAGAGALAASGEASNKARLRAQTEEAIAKGLFGAPSFVVGDELFWGNDRLDAAVEWARSGRSPGSPSGARELPRGGPV